MTATQFTDDAFNKHNCENGTGGTLIGNWSEERSIRDATGEGRTVPQRHIPRSGLLTDFTKVPSSGPRAVDNTFERIYGHRSYDIDERTSDLIGAGDTEHIIKKPIADTLQAEGRIARIGERQTQEAKAMREFAIAQVQEEEALEAEERNARFFDTTTGTVHCKPDETQTVKSEHLRASRKQELMHGAPADRMMSMNNKGLGMETHVHYANADPVTHHRMALDDPAMRGDMRVSASGGVSAFGKHSDFSKPIGEFQKGQMKDHEMDSMYASLKGTQPLRSLGGSKPHSQAFKHVDSLSELKEIIKAHLGQVFGPYGYVMLRKILSDLSDHEGFVSKENASRVIREDLKVDESEISVTALTVYIKQQLTMKKNDLRVSSFMSSLRPALSLEAKKAVLLAFASLGPNSEGYVTLGTWLSRTPEETLKKTVIMAFGFEELEHCEGLPVTEDIFIEFFSDLSPLVDIEAVLPGAAPPS